MPDRFPAASASPKEHRLKRFFTAVPPARTALTGALLWGTAMAICLLVGVENASAGMTNHRPGLLLLYFAGGTLAFPVAFYVVRLLAPGRNAEARFCAAFVFLTLTTIGMTAILSAIVYWNTSFDWDGEPYTTKWLYQLAFSAATALYQFAVIGIRHYLPLGMIVLFPASLWLTRATR